ncbi:MAG: hypothetical protein NTW26_02720 [bacterium]|nr:hypothetical protein [bacterium]
MRKALLLGGVVLLFAALTACSDGLSTGADDPLADRADYYVYGTVYIPPTSPHTATVGLRHVYTEPGGTYLKETTAGQNGYYQIYLGDLSYCWLACDAWYEEDDTRWQGTSSDFYWDGDLYPDYHQNIIMYEQ